MCTLFAMPDMHVELRDHRLNRTRDVFLILGLHSVFLNSAAAPRTTRRQCGFEHTVNAFGLRAMHRAMTSFLPRFLGGTTESEGAGSRRLAAAFWGGPSGVEGGAEKAEDA